MQSHSLWELLLAGALAVFVIFIFRHGIKQAMEQSRVAPKDWRGALIPLALVVVFVIVLIALVR